jgi:TonB family protein
LTEPGGCCLCRTMWIRVFICLAISVLIHFLFFFHHEPSAVPGKALSGNHLVPIGLVAGIYQNRQAQEVKPVPEKPLEGNEEGVTFVTEGNVSAGYMEVLKKKIFDTWEYPEDAVNKGQQGKVTISFVLDNTGNVKEIGVVKTSGSHILDSAAMAAVEKAAPFGRFNGQMKDRTLKITGNFCYVLD